MCYLEATNNYTGGGLDNYVISPAIITSYGGDETAARNAMKAEFKEVFVKGNI